MQCIVLVKINGILQHGCDPTMAISQSVSHPQKRIKEEKEWTLLAVVRHVISASFEDHSRAYVTLLPASDFRKQQKKNILIPLPPASVPRYPHLFQWMSCLCFYLRPIPLLICSPLSSLLPHGYHTSNYLLSPDLLISSF